MKVDPKVIKAKLAKVEIQFHRFPKTNAVFAIAHDDTGFILGTGIGSSIDPKEFKITIGKKVAKEQALKNAEDKLWEIEGILLKEKLKSS